MAREKLDAIRHPKACHFTADIAARRPGSDRLAGKQVLRTL
jgi:hypothetical protein